MGKPKASAAGAGAGAGAGELARLKRENAVLRARLAGEPNACSDPPCNIVSKVKNGKRTGERDPIKSVICERHQQDACDDPGCAPGKPCAKHTPPGFELDEGEVG